MAAAEEEVTPMPSSTSPTAREVEEELILPASTSLQSDEDTVLPRSTSLEGEDELPDTSLPSSSEWPEPQGTSLSEPSSVPLESSPLTFSSLSLSPSPLSWKEPSNGLAPQLKKTEGRGEQISAPAGLDPGEQTKAKKKGPPAKKAMPGQWDSARAMAPQKCSQSQGRQSWWSEGGRRGQSARAVALCPDCASLWPPGWALTKEQWGVRQRSGWFLTRAQAQQRTKRAPTTLGRKLQGQGGERAALGEETEAG